MSTRPAAIVTGAAGGIGKVISQFLGAEGFRVVVADLDVFLASPAAAAITGQSINVDGGLIWD